MRFRPAFLATLVVSTLMSVLPGLAQSKTPTRDQTRELLRGTFDRMDPAKLHITFRQSDKQPYNFVGHLTTDLKNAQSMEVVVSVTTGDTIGFRIYPHYGSGYINVGKAQDSAGLMRKLLYLSDRNFLFWGVDESGDVFAGYTITLESGYPEEAVRIVLRSIAELDRFVGDLRVSIDGSSAAAQ